MAIANFALLSVALATAYAPATAADGARQAEANAALTVYPRESLANGEQGIVFYHVTIDGRGHPTDCEITQSSGYERLDMATCSMLMDRARFTPGRDGRGHATRSTFDTCCHPFGSRPSSSIEAATVSAMWRTGGSRVRTSPTRGTSSWLVTIMHRG